MIRVDHRLFVHKALIIKGRVAKNMHKVKIVVQQKVAKI